MFMDILTWVNQLFCGVVRGHGDLVRERDGDGHLGLRCRDCMKLMPNTFESIGVAPPRKDYNPAKVGQVNYKVGA